MKLWKWEVGRQQNCEYWKFTLWYFRIGKWGFDGYILKYSPNTYLNWHRDLVDGGEHSRINICIDGYSSFLWRLPNSARVNYTNKKIIKFRPDIYEHSVYVGNQGCTKLSFGFVKYK